MKKYSIIMFILSLLTLVLFACSGKGPLPPADTISPSLSLTSPVNGAQDVAVNSSVSIMFSEAMDPSTINEQTITLSMRTGKAPGSVAYSDTTAVFTPASSLDPETIYTVMIDDGVTDVAGNALTTPVSYIFITGASLASTTMSLSAPGVTYNANGIVTITVSSGGGIPTGTVSLRIDGGTAVVQALTGGSTSFTVPGPSAGSYTLSAEYAAQGSFEASSASGTLIVNQALTTTAITAPVVTYGADGFVTVTVSSAAGTPTGDVSLSVDGGAATTQGLINGASTFTVPVPSAGSHTLNAAYAAQGNFGASSAIGALGVGLGATSMLLDAPAVIYGADGIVTVTVRSAAGTPTGTVSLSVDGETAVEQSLNGGSTSFTVPGPGAGSHTLNAAYAAQGSFGASSASGTLIVNQASTSTEVTSSPNPSTLDEVVTLTASVTPSWATGTVTFRDDTTVLGTSALSGGAATFSTSMFTGGVHSVTAEYGGDAHFAASTSTALSQTVNDVILANYVILSIAGLHGRITPSGMVSVSYGADQRFTIKPDKKYTIKDVRVNGVSQGPVDSYTFTSVTANHTIVATFKSFDDD